MNNQTNIFMFLLIQIISIHNAVSLVWNVRKIGKNSYELSIKKNDTRNALYIPSLEKIINDIVSYKMV